MRYFTCYISSVLKVRKKLKYKDDYYKDFQNKIEELFRFHVNMDISCAAGSDEGRHNCFFENSNDHLTFIEKFVFREGLR